MTSAGLRQRSKPLAVYLFMGPTGVGKTEMARCLATYLFGDARAMIRLDMSEYTEEHSVARLTGAPPGYVGHMEGGQLTNALRTTPYGLVLLDEIDKAHPRVFDLFLQLFDEGRLTDARGRTVDARHTLFVMTCNPLTPDRRLHIGFNPTLSGNERLVLTSAFRPEFLNRIDEVIVFEQLDRKYVRTLVERSLEELRSGVLDRYGVSLKIAPDVIDWLTGQAFDPDYGVRELKRTVEKLVDRPLATWLSKTGGNHPASIRILLDENDIQVLADDPSVL